MNKPNTIEEIKPSKIPAIIENLNTELGIVIFHNRVAGENQMIDIIMRNLAEEYPGVSFFKTVTDYSNSFFQKLGVRTFPFTLVIKKESIVDCIEGLISKKQFREKINGFIEN